MLSRCRNFCDIYGFVFFFLGDDLAILLAGAFPGVTWHPP